MKSLIKVNAIAVMLSIFTTFGAAAEGWKSCAATSLRYGVEAGEWAAMNAAETKFLGPHAGAGVTGGSLTDDLLAQGTEVKLFKVTETSAGLCDDTRRIVLRMSPIAADLPQGIGIFTDHAVLVGVGLGVRAEKFFWRPLGRWQAGLGLGLEADWHKLHLRSALVDMRSESTSISLPVTLALKRPLGRRGEIEVWLRHSWSTEGTQGQAVGIGFTQRY